MSTNNNNAAQTLFRFTSLRNPILTDTHKRNIGFIHRPDGVKGAFDSAVAGKTTAQEKLTAMKAAANNVESQMFPNVSAIENGEFGQLLKIGEKLSRKEKLTAAQSDFCKNYYAGLQDSSKELTTQGIQKLQQLWDNFIYQAVTQKNFYVKEAVVQVLKAIHIGFTILMTKDEDFYNTNGQDYMPRAIDAKVVLPKYLFQNDSDAPVSSISNKVANTGQYNGKAIAFAEASLDMAENKKLIGILQNLELEYRTGYEKAYSEAYASYEKETKPLRDRFAKEAASWENRNKAIENRVKYLTELSIANPEIFKSNPQLGEELQKLNYELMEREPVSADIPEFEFSYEPEIEPSYLERRLSVEAKATLLKATGAESVSDYFSRFSAFSGIIQAIQNTIDQNQQTILSSTVLNQQVSTTVGGVIVGVSSTNYADGTMPFSVKTFGKSNSEWGILCALDDNTLQIVSGNYKVSVNGAEISSQTIVQNAAGSAVLFDNNPRIPVTQTGNTGGFVLSGELVLSDGKTYTMSVTLIKDNAQLDRLTKSYIFKGNAILTELVREVPSTSDPKEPTPSQPKEGAEESPAFIPSGYGMKNIGVADYRKVEQSTYCYVEGDVAHIENIMAREYKERSTRRLKRSESQTTTSSETEKEKLSDTTSTERHEMQSEISKILQESRDFSASAGMNVSWGKENSYSPKFNLSANASYATHNSKEESNRQAVTEAKDITARALDRIVTKVKEERIDKIIEEYEENNKHGFDNTKGDKHVVGVFRWVDKVVKNQIYNYGKRMMFEFMVPEPGKLHKLGMAISENKDSQLVKPVDPRESPLFKLNDFSSLENETALKFWLSRYNVEVDEKPAENLSIGWQYSFGNEDTNSMSNSKDEGLSLPEGYYTVSWNFGQTGHQYNGSNWGISVGNDIHVGAYNYQTWNNLRPLHKFVGKIPLSVYFDRYWAATVNVELQLSLLPEAKNAWLQKTFNKIIEAYENELAKYNQQIADAKDLGVKIKGSNPGFYRKIENTILRRNCISYMLDQNPAAALSFGKNNYYNNDGASVETFANVDILVNKNLDQYAAFVKFMEQAFEWEIMSYSLYPYYWGSRKSWQDLYQFEDNDPIFRAFMQSGMARVVVTVRPGFEDAVRHYLATGQIWNGGEVPVLDDPLFLSIVDEMRAPQGTKEGEPWREKIPTALTILQADSIGLKVEKALPCNCEPGEKFDDTLGEMCGSNFELNDNQIGQSADKWMEVTFNEIDDPNKFKIMRDYLEAGMFPIRYECLGHTITVDKDWGEDEPASVIYKAIAEQVSKIDGVEAFASGENGITFRILASKIKDFDFREASGEKERSFSFTTDAESFVKINLPSIDTGLYRILDASWKPLSEPEYSEKAPFSKFSV